MPRGKCKLFSLTILLVSVCISCQVRAQTTRGWRLSRSTSRNRVTGSSQQEWTWKTFPNPQLQPGVCSRGTERSWVCDPNGVLTRYQADDLDKMLTNQYRMGSCVCKSKCNKSPSHRGIQGAIAIVNQMYFRESYPTKSEKRKMAEKFAESLRDEAWEYGLCNDDYVIFVSVKDRQVYTATGEGARPIMTDNCINTVYAQVRPQLSAGDFGMALQQMVQEYGRVLLRSHPCNTIHKSRNLTNILLPLGIVGGVIAAGCGAVCFCRNKGSGSSSENQGLTTVNDNRYYKSKESERRGSNDSVSSGGGGGDF